MRKHMAVFGLLAKSSLWKVVGILLAMCAAEIVLFRFALQDALEAHDMADVGMATLEQLLAKSWGKTLFKAALVLISVAVCLPGCKFKSNPDYTLRRLSISERMVFFHQAVYNMVVYCMLIAAQLGVVFGLANYYVAAVPKEYASGQTVMLAFYRDRFLHSLLPMEDVGLWIRNGLLVITLGLAAAGFPYRQRRQDYSLTVIAVVLYTLVYFERGIGDLFHVITTSIIALLVIGEILYKVVTRRYEEE